MWTNLTRWLYDYRDGILWVLVTLAICALWLAGVTHADVYDDLVRQSPPANDRRANESHTPPYAALNQNDPRNPLALQQGAHQWSYDPNRPWRDFAGDRDYSGRGGRGHVQPGDADWRGRRGVDDVSR